MFSPPLFVLRAWRWLVVSVLSPAHQRYQGVSMYTEAVQTLADQAVAKLAAQRRSLPGHIVRSMLAGMYVGAAIVLIFTICGTLSTDSRRPDHRHLCRFGVVHRQQPGAHARNANPEDHVEGPARQLDLDVDRQPAR